MSERETRADECEQVADLLNTLAFRQLQPVKAATLEHADQLRRRAQAHRQK